MQIYLFLALRTRTLGGDVQVAQVRLNSVLQLVGFFVVVVDFLKMLATEEITLNWTPDESI